MAAKAGTTSAAAGADGQAKEGGDKEESEETQANKRRKIAQPAEGAGVVFRKPGEDGLDE